MHFTLNKKKGYMPYFLVPEEVGKQIGDKRFIGTIGD
jgi:hypothetical protein